jgi:hypothetical protein
MLLARTSTVHRLNILCYRDQENDESCKSILLNITLPEGETISTYANIVGNVATIQSNDTCPKALGWELNPKGQLVPRFVNLQNTMDPARFAIINRTSHL